LRGWLGYPIGGATIDSIIFEIERAIRLAGERGRHMPRKITRSTFLMGVGGAALLAALRPSEMVRAQSARPNILWIIDDDHPQYMMDPMPTVRRRIRDAGVNFTSGSADVPLCGPARVSLLTGLSITTHECDTNGTWPQFEGSPRGLAERTVAKHLKGVGYATGHFGKYINAHARSLNVPAYWDRWCETLGDGMDQGNNAQVPNRANVDGHLTDVLDQIPSGWGADRCAEFIRDRSGGSWFAQYCPTIPHQPYYATKDSEHRFDGAKRRVSSFNERDMSDKPRWMRQLKKQDQADISREFEGKKEELADLDLLGIRPILAALYQTGQLANSYIFFTSDNGYLHGEHRLRKKDQPYWESSEVPFFVRGPGIGRDVRAALVNHTDFMPTTCALAGIPYSTLDVDGRSMASSLKSSNFSGWRKRMLITGSQDTGPQMNPGGAHNPSGRWWLLREGSMAFIMHENGGKELYWLKSDPHQEHNKRPKAKQSLINRLTDTTKALRGAEGESRRRLEVR
jgi:N-acetylglucosamine-6-sulfatase